ncbi:MAG: InlB B-repeat-containing protein [Chloroflexota bacterium]
MTGARRIGRPALALVVALAVTGAVSPTVATAEPVYHVLEISEPFDSTGEGAILCEFKYHEEEAAFEEEEEECEELELPGKALVKLIPIPERGSEFVDFEKGTGSAEVCNGKTEFCRFYLEKESYVEARFAEITPALAVKTTGEGEVLCTEEGLSIAFAEECEEEYEFEAEVTLVPEPEEGWEFAGFKGGTGSAKSCNGKTELCTFFIEEDSTIEATFVPAMRKLTVERKGTGSGSVTSSPAGISCGSICSAKFAAGKEVTLKASPAAGSTFAGWSGGGCSGTGACVVTIGEADVTVTATFTVNPPPEPEEPKEGTEEPKEGTEGTSKGTEGTQEGTIGAGTAWAARRARVGSGKTRIRLTCSGGPCNGMLKLKAKLRRRGRRVVVGETAFSLADGTSEVLKVRLSATARRQLRRRRVLRVKAAGPGVAAGALKLRLGGRR